MSYLKLNRRRFILQLIYNIAALYGLTMGFVIGCTKNKGSKSIITDLPEGVRLIYEGHERAEKMKYTNTHSSVDTNKFPSKTASQMCSTCAHFTPLKDAPSYGHCDYIDDDKWVVSKQGWCSFYKLRGSEDNSRKLQSMVAKH